LAGQAALLLMDLFPGGGMGDPFDRAVMVGDDRPFEADAKVDAAGGSRVGRGAGLVGDDRLDRHEQPPALLGQRHRQDPCPALGDQPLQPAGVLLGAEFADHRQDEVAPIGLKTHRAGGEADPATVAAAGLEAGEPHWPAGAAARLGVRPGTKRRHQVGDAGGVGLLRGAPPPGRNLVFGLVPGPAELVKVP
jgi:hypothetical protein